MSSLGTGGCTSPVPAPVHCLHLNPHCSLARPTRQRLPFKLCSPWSPTCCLQGLHFSPYSLVSCSPANPSPSPLRSGNGVPTCLPPAASLCCPGPSSSVHSSGRSPAPSGRRGLGNRRNQQPSLPVSSWTGCCAINQKEPNPQCTDQWAWQVKDGEPATGHRRGKLAPLQGQGRATLQRGLRAGGASQELETGKSRVGLVSPQNPALPSVDCAVSGRLVHGADGI